MIIIRAKEIIMKAIQITLMDELHQRSKAVALANHLTLKQFVTDAIEAHVARMEPVTAPLVRTEKEGAR